MLANSRRVKPVAHLHVDQRFKGFAAVFRPLLLPDLPNTFHIALSEVGGIGLAAVGDELQRCVGAGRAIWRSKSTGITTMARMRPACIISISCLRLSLTVASV